MEFLKHLKAILCDKKIPKEAAEKAEENKPFSVNEKIYASRCCLRICFDEVGWKEFAKEEEIIRGPRSFLL